MQKLRVGVLMGGKSIEKEVSFNSGRTVCDHLDTSRYEIVPLFQTQAGTLYLLPWHFLHRGKTSDFEHRLPTEAQTIAWDDLKELIDFMYIAVHGRYAEDGTLQGFLEVLGIPYLGSGIFSSALGMNKVVQKKVLKIHGIDVPKGISLEPHEIATFEDNKNVIFERLDKAGVSLPYLVKPCFEGSSLGITIVRNKKDLYDALIKACTVYQQKKQTVLIEEKLEGMEFTCIPLRNYKKEAPLCMPPTEVIPEDGTHFFDYDQKYMPGRATKRTPPNCSSEMIRKIQTTCIQVAKILEMVDMSRTDGFVTNDGRVVIVDPNTLSGMAPASFLFREAAEINMSHTQLINHLIETALHRYGMLEAIEQQERKEQKKMKAKKIRVAVLMGGASNEKEISLESGRNILYKLSPNKYATTPLFVSSKMELFKINQSLLVRNSTKEIESMLDPKTKLKWTDLPEFFNFIFIGLHGGVGENGGVQGTLEMLGMPYNGSSVLASALCMDKHKTNQYLQANGFSIPQAQLIDKHEYLLDKTTTIKKITGTIPFPLIIKPHDDGCSVMVQKAKTAQQLQDALNTLFASEKTYALVEECIQGMELTVGVIGNDTPKVLPASQALSAGEILSIEEKFLPGAGENQTPAPISPETMKLVQTTMEGVYKTAGCKGYARIDCFYQTAAQSPTGTERVVTIEINTLPGMTPATCIFHQAAEIGIKPMDFIDLIVEYGFEEHTIRTVTKKDTRGAISAKTRDDEASR